MSPKRGMSRQATIYEHMFAYASSERGAGVIGMPITGMEPGNTERGVRMQRLRLVSVALAVTALTSVGVAACGDDDDEGGGGGDGESLDLVIGNIFPQTGALASFSPAFEK